ncbi:MAG: hypothetical protein ABEH64_05260 [Salinirussus sp.]
MSRYDDEYGTWASLDTADAYERAYALGVEAALGHYDEDELAAIRAEMDSPYARSVVDLAFDEGRTAGLEAKRGPGDAADAWQDLVLDESLDADGETIEDDSGPPAPVGRIELLDRLNDDARASLELPDFLQR